MYHLTQDNVSMILVAAAFAHPIPECQDHRFIAEKIAQPPPARVSFWARLTQGLRRLGLPRKPYGQPMAS